jgi:adenine-specific DNA-methyltransferase
MASFVVLAVCRAAVSNSVAFFPDRSAWKKLVRALGGTIDGECFEDLTGMTSLPFKAGKHRRVAVEVIDPRGNELVRVLRLPS